MRNSCLLSSGTSFIEFRFGYRESTPVARHVPVQQVPRFAFLGSLRFLLCALDFHPPAGIDPVLPQPLPLFARPEFLKHRVTDSCACVRFGTFANTSQSIRTTNSNKIRGTLTVSVQTGV